MQQINNLIINVQSQSMVVDPAVDMQLRAFSSNLMEEVRLLNAQAHRNQDVLIQEGQHMSILRDEVSQAQSMYELTAHNEVRMRATHMMHNACYNSIGMNLAESIQRSELEAQHLHRMNEEKD